MMVQMMVQTMGIHWVQVWDKLMDCCLVLLLDYMSVTHKVQKLETLLDSCLVLMMVLKMV